MLQFNFFNLPKIECRPHASVPRVSVGRPLFRHTVNHEKVISSPVNRWSIPSAVARPQCRTTVVGLLEEERGLLQFAKKLGADDVIPIRVPGRVRVGMHRDDGDFQHSQTLP